jgi:heterodisulfide reductase subunit C
MTQQQLQKDSLGPAENRDVLAPVRKMVQACIQCGTCTGSCPNQFAMDFTPRRLWRLVIRGEKRAIFNSKTFTLCSSCYYCTLRCPRGLKLTEAMATLKQIAARENMALYRPSLLFYKYFLDSVRRYGRIREMEFMSRYFLARKNPWVPISYTPLGWKLLSRGKVSLKMPSRQGQGTLEAIFRKVEEMEAQP